MAKVTREELQNVTGEAIESLLRDRRYRLSTSPFGAAPGKAVAFIARSVPWKKRGRIPRNLHLVE